MAWTHAQTPGETTAQLLARTVDVVGRNSLALTLFVYPASLLWLGFCRHKFDKRSFISLGLRRPRALPNAARGLVAGLLSIALLWSILWLTGAIQVAGISDAARQAGARAIFPLVGWAIAFAAVGFFEEITFRGYALHNLTNWLGWKGAVAVQAILFALVHLGNVAAGSTEAKMAALGALPSLFLIAVFFALCYRKTGSLWFPIGFHAAWNFSLGCLFSLPVSGLNTFQLLKVSPSAQSWFSGGSFGAEGSLVLLPILLAAIYFLSQAPDHPQALLDLGLIKVAPRVAPEIAPESEVEDDPNRENRYRTKFGTSEGFDEGMLRELRALQIEREAAEAQTRRARDEAQIIEIEALQPTASAPENAESVVEPIAPVETLEVEVKTPAPAPKIEIVPPVAEPATPAQPKTPRRSVVFAPRADAATSDAATSDADAPKKAAAPLQTPAQNEKPDETPAPVPPKKKSAPRW